MYVVDCRECRTRLSYDARICPRCGSLQNGIKAVPVTYSSYHRPYVELGESEWRPGR